MKETRPLTGYNIAASFNLGPARGQKAVEIMESEELDVSRKMDAFNTLLHGYGVAPIHDRDGTLIAEYINFGDTYSPTLLFDIKESEFVLTSWGDWYEKWESKHNEEIKLEYVGTVSEGTMRADDLIPKFLDVAEEMAERLGDEDAAREVKGYRCDYNSLSDDAPEEEWDYLLNEEIWSLMEDLAPDGYYFGAHPGDGADFGFWRCEDEQ